MTCPSFLSNGGDGHTILARQKVDYRNGELDTDVFQKYLKTRSPIDQDIDHRIKIVKASSKHAIEDSSALKDSVPMIVQAIFILFNFII